MAIPKHIGHVIEGNTLRIFFEDASERDWFVRWLGMQHNPPDPPIDHLAEAERQLAKVKLSHPYRLTPAEEVLRNDDLRCMSAIGSVIAYLKERG